jgi:ribonucleoside-triphosphate reductase (formate)
MKQPKYVIKRNGEVDTFEKKRITDAIYEAFKSAEEGNYILAQKVASSVVMRLLRYYGEEIPSVEEIQDVVERELMNYNFLNTAKMYILYRNKQHEKRESKN